MRHVLREKKTRYETRRAQRRKVRCETCTQRRKVRYETCTENEGKI